MYEERSAESGVSRGAVRRTERRTVTGTWAERGRVGRGGEELGSAARMGGSTGTADRFNKSNMCIGVKF